MFKISRQNLNFKCAVVHLYSYQADRLARPSNISRKKRHVGLTEKEGKSVENHTWTSDWNPLLNLDFSPSFRKDFCPWKELLLDVNTLQNFKLKADGWKLKIQSILFLQYHQIGRLTWPRIFMNKSPYLHKWNFSKQHLLRNFETYHNKSNY